MKRYLTQTDRALILKELTKEQKKTLFSVVGRSYRSYFSNLLAKYKGTRDWMFYKYIDHGSVQKEIRCECGKALRHQYVLINKKTREKRNIGSTHFIEELQIPETIAKDVLKGIHNINFDLDELLQKHAKGWELPAYLRDNMNKVKVPGDIEKLLRMDLPLLSRQVDLLYSKLLEINSKNQIGKRIYTVKLRTGGSVEYEIKNEEIYKVLIGEVDFNFYIDTFKKDIDSFIKKTRKYTPIYDLINSLVNKGLPNELMYGQHALTNHFIEYLNKRNDIALRRKDDGYVYFKQKGN